MRRSLLAVALLGVSANLWAAPNVTNSSQKGSLLIFPDIRVDDVFDGNLQPSPTVWQPPLNTLIRIQNDGGSEVDVKCYWMDGHKNRVDFVFTITRNQPVWFDARTGNGSTPVNRFPTGQANGFTAGNRHPFLEAGGAFDINTLAGPQLGTGAPGVYDAPNGDGYGPYARGMLVCWAVDDTGQNQVKWNHLSGTATVWSSFAANSAAYEYSAYAFYVPTGTDLSPVGTPGTINLNGLEYDACPLYQIGQFTPIQMGPDDGYRTQVAAVSPNFPAPLPATNPPLPRIFRHRLAIMGCTLGLNQDWSPTFTKLQFDVWNEEEVKFTGAFECADSWHDTDFRPGTVPQNNASLTPGVPGFVNGFDSATQNFNFFTLQTFAARYRVQGVASSQCNRTKGTSNDTVAAVTTQPVGLIGVASAISVAAEQHLIGTTLTGAGKFNGKIVWDPAGVVPEGGIR